MISDQAVVTTTAADRRTHQRPDANVIAWFDEVVRRQPDAIALTLVGEGGPDTETHVTYAELSRRAERLTSRLQARGVGPETVVGIGLDDHASGLVAIIATLKAGGCFLPIDPRFPPARVSRIVADSRMCVLVTCAAQRPRYEASGAPLMLFDDVEPPVPCHSIAAAFAGSAAAVIYTSGSTGEPKGVVLTDEGVANHARSFAALLDLSAADVVLQFASLAMDTAYEEILPCLCRGGRLVIRNTEMVQDVVTLLQRCADQQVTILDLPTALWPSMTEVLRSKQAVLPASVRCIVLGGEEAPAAALPYWSMHQPQVTVFNSYGPSEATIIVTAGAVRADASGTPDGVPLGDCLPGTAIHLDPVTDPSGRERATGEIYISGIGVARGYIGSPRLTAERFMPDALAADGSRAYRTGDLAERQENGALVFRGRRDRQVKISGHRIQLEEVEQAILAHPAIPQCAVTVQDNRMGGRRLVAFCALRRSDPSLPYQPTTPGASALRAFLAERLPPYMIPGQFSFLEKFILDGHGKIDRSTLPQIGHFNRARRHLPEYQWPRPGPESRLAQIWCSVLDLEDDEVSALDPFEYLGGNSLYGIQVRYRARQAGLLFKASDMHSQQTIRGLAACCRNSADVRARVRDRVEDWARYARALGRAVTVTAAGEVAARLRSRERRVRQMVSRFHGSLPNTTDIVYLFFTTHELHWLTTTLGFAPADANVVLIGSGLRADELAFVRANITRPFLDLDERISPDAMLDVLFDVNTGHFGWLDVDCFVLNPSLFREMTRIAADVAVNSMWTHAACGPAKRPFHLVLPHFVFFNADVIDRLRRSRTLGRPSATRAGWRQVRALRRLAQAGDAAGIDGASAPTLTHRLFAFEFGPLAIYQLVANASGYRLNRVRFLTELDTFNLFNYYSDEAIHVFPTIRHCDLDDVSDANQRWLLGADYLLLTSMLEQLPPSYAARKEAAEQTFRRNGLEIETIRLEIVGHLSRGGVSERSFSRPEFRWLTTPRPPLGCGAER